MKPIRLSSAQESALECRDWSEEPAVREAWRGSQLFPPEDDEQREQLWRELNDASNAEDDFAEDQGNDGDGRKYARRASRSLACLASRVLSS